MRLKTFAGGVYNLRLPSENLLCEIGVTAIIPISEIKLWAFDHLGLFQNSALEHLTILTLHSGDVPSMTKRLEASFSSLSCKQQHKMLDYRLTQSRFYCLSFCFFGYLQFDCIPGLAPQSLFFGMHWTKVTFICSWDAKSYQVAAQP